MKKIFFAGIIMISFITMIASCSLNGGTNSTPGAAFLISQASPTAVPFDFYLDGSIYFRGIGYTNYNQYSVVAPGTHTFQFVPVNTTSPTLLSLPVSLQANYTYSFFTIDSVNTLKGALVLDNTSVPTGDTAKIRFMQFSPLPVDSTVDFAYKDSSIISGGRTFNDQDAAPVLDSFINIKAGFYNFNVLLHGPESTLFSMPSQTLMAGKVYTIVFTGLSSLNGTALGLNSYIVQHN